MVRTIVIAAALSAAWMCAAGATDLPGKDKAAEVNEPEGEESPPIPVFSWSGAYAGLHAGAAFGHDASHLVQPAVPAAGFDGASRGIIGGGHVGYNHAISGAFGEHDVVLGVEGDVDGADDGRSAQAFGRAFEATSDLKGSMRGRIGVAASRVLVFATGGVTFADVNAATIDRASGVDVRVARSSVGYTLGAGVEYAFTNSYALRAEYRASAYRPVTTPLDPAAVGMAVSRRETDNSLQAGISYRFGSLVPSAE